jgi:hypothetical protein
MFRGGPAPTPAPSADGDDARGARRAAHRAETAEGWGPCAHPQSAVEKIAGTVGYRCTACGATAWSDGVFRYTPSVLHPAPCPGCARFVGGPDGACDALRCPRQQDPPARSPGAGPPADPEAQP